MKPTLAHELRALLGDPYCCADLSRGNCAPRPFCAVRAAAGPVEVNTDCSPDEARTLIAQAADLLRTRGYGVAQCSDRLSVWSAAAWRKMEEDRRKRLAVPARGLAAEESNGNA